MELTKKEISYLATYLEEEICRTEKAALDRYGRVIFPKDIDIQNWIENGISAFNGGAR